MTNVEDTASVIDPSKPVVYPPGTAHLLVLDERSASIVHLPRVGQLIIGRDQSAHVNLQTTSVSRRQATILIDEGGMRIADLESHNGTYVNNELLQYTRGLSSGDVIRVGNATIVVHASVMPVVSRATHTEKAWRRRLVEEVDRTLKTHRSLAVIQIEGIAPATVAAMGETLRLMDVVGEDVDQHVLVLLPEVSRQHARTIASALLAGGVRSTNGARAGLAMCPDDATDADTLIQGARQAAKMADLGAVAEVRDTTNYIELGRHGRVLVVDPAMREMYEMIERIASSPLALPVLIRGETGSGKEFAARALHHFSRREGAFVAVNCASIPENLLESELFGHEKGAFTGALVTHIGAFEQADRGTLFLDEIGELPLAQQAKLLRVLDDNKFKRIGGTKEIAVDVRVVTATNRDLDVETREGRFKHDLYPRLKGAVVFLLPLRERRSEIAMLARHFVEADCREAKIEPKTITSEAMQVLIGHPWPDNVRGLKYTIRRAIQMAPDQNIEVSDLGLDEAPPAPPQPPAPPEPLTEDPPETFMPLKDELHALEAKRIRQALQRARGVKTKAADLLRCPIRTFTNKCKEHGL